MFLRYSIIFVLYGLLQSLEISSTKPRRKNVLCYHGTWSRYRQSLGKFDIADINPYLCTHILYAFFGIQENGELRIIDPYLDLEDKGGLGNIKRFNALKLQNPTLMTLAAVGGWNEGSTKFSQVAKDPKKRARFTESVVQFIQKFGFDGLDLDWEYPNQRHSLSNDDRTNYITWLRELREGLDPFGYLLTAAVGSTEFSASLSYNIREVAKYLDLINVMAYDLHGPWDEVTGINAPLFAGNRTDSARAKELNVDAIVKYWIKQGAPKEKLIIGMPFYGRSFTLESTTQYGLGAPHVGRGIAGQYSLEAGVLGYNEMCEKMLKEQWTTVWDDQQMVSYAYRDRQWVSFETPHSIGLKTKYVLDNDLAGIMVWSIESDDFRGVCHREKYPLLKTINNILFGTNAPDRSTPSKNVASLSSTTVSTNTTPENFSCQTHSGYVRDHSDCSKFYFCDDAGLTYNFKCPHALSFDLLTFTCNYAELVECPRVAV